MRRLAAALGTGAGSLYRHFESREALLVAVHDHAIGELLAVAPSGSTPVERVATFARSLRTLVRRRPYLAELWRTTQQLGPNALRARERGLQAGLACGLAPEAAARAYLTVLHYTIAFSSLEQGLALISEADREGAAELFASLPAEEFPATRSAAHVLTRTTLNEEFEAGLQALLAGIGIGAAHLPESTPPIRRPPV
jgi:AcrR family transcriptional regulator